MVATFVFVFQQITAQQVKHPWCLICTDGCSLLDLTARPSTVNSTFKSRPSRKASSLSTTGHRVLRTQLSSHHAGCHCRGLRLHITPLRSIRASSNQRHRHVPADPIHGSRSGFRDEGCKHRPTHRWRHGWRGSRNGRSQCIRQDLAVYSRLRPGLGDWWYNHAEKG